MDIQTMAAWGELLGGISGLIAAVGGIATLLYLAIQLRQNTEAVRTSTIQGVERGISELMASWTNSVENAVIVRKGFSAYDELSDDEKDYMQLSFRRLILHMDTLYWSYRHGLLPQEIWEREQTVLKQCINSSGGRTAWNVGGFTEPFREHVETTLIRD